ncbi:MAG: DUF3598 family protein [Nodosilinea sp. LVE1205-7]
MANQWQRLLRNQGTWVGSFTQLDPLGTILQDTPSQVSLLPLQGGELMRQEIRLTTAGESPRETVLEYRSLGRGVLFCENGAFSQGAIQWSPVSEFGAELGLREGSDRLRLVLLFPRQPHLGSLTLIREHQQGTTPLQRRPLTLDQLVGTWAGQAVTVYPDWQPEKSCSTRLVIKRQGTDRLLQSLYLDGGQVIESQARVEGSILAFDQGCQPVNVLLLPDGASATFPRSIQPGQPFFLEAGWLVTPTLRHRLVRHYNAQGTWISLTLVIEEKLAEFPEG